ncbi:MAG: hypothetical protein GY750_01605 [Lentisphaerae bacterium]|nr:hypothetical protein [Lentisphaerota bacterium]MCP4100116.1 hypothetical protein [Lentisphaerota bacterium]
MRTRTVMMLMAVGIFGAAFSSMAEDSKCNDAGKDVKKCKADKKCGRGMLRKYINEKYPEEVKAIKELRKTDPKAAKEKSKELIKKAFREMSPEMKEKMRKRGKEMHKNVKAFMYAREKYPEDMKALKELRKKDSKAAKAKLDELIEKAKKEMPEDWKSKRSKHHKMGRHGKMMGMHALQTKYGKEMNEIRELRKTDPKAAKEKFEALRKQAKSDFKAEREKFIALVKKYRETKDPKLLEEIKADVAQSTERRIEFRRKMVQKMQERLNSESKKLKDAEAKKDEIVKKRVQEIVQDPNLNW